jgi:hypothetical protein
MADKQIAFVAYPGRDKSLSSLISQAVSRANAKPIALRYEQWEFNDIPGNPLISPIVEGIDESSFVVADITYLNLNVVYEIGYAIGRRKRAFLIRHRGTDGDKVLANAAGIFDTLGYHEYDNVDDLAHRLTSHIEPLPLQIEETLDRRAPVYVVEPTSRGDAETMMVSRLKKARYRYRSFNPNEDSRLSAVDAIRQVSTSSGVLVCLQTDSVTDGRTNNIRALFVSGLAHGLGKPTLILAPFGLTAPLDILDETKTFRYPNDIGEHIAALSLEITDYQQQVDPPPVRLSTRLQALRMGDPTAENEMTTLSSYYLPIDQYKRAMQGDVNLVVGRKGSGKTALFIQLRDRVRSDKRNIVVDLKPEGYQLLKLKEDILAYLSEGSRQHLVTAFWEYLLLLEVAYKLLEKDRNTYKHNHLITQPYLDLEETYRTQEFSAEGDFSERLLSLSRRIAGEYQAKYGTTHLQRLTTDELTQLLYLHDIRSLRLRLSRYLEQKQSVWILFDNLDKGWSTQGVDDIDALVLRCLINAGRAIERDMRREGRVFHCVVFVRNDVYEHLMRGSSDYGKEMRAVLDWTDRDLLREMLRLRLVSGLEKTASTATLEQLIPLICISHFEGHEVVDHMIDLSLMRPRNLLKIFVHSRGFASNFNHDRISEEDLEKGTAAYSQDLLLELDRELTDVFPAAEDVLYQFLDAKSELSKKDLFRLIFEASNSEDYSAKVIDFLLYYGVIGLRTVEKDLYIYDVDYDSRKLRVRIDRAGDDVRFCINPAFWPALSIQRT